MSNYPPGVTGNEYEIAGPDAEFEEEFECWNENFSYVRISEYAFNYCSEFGKKVNRTEEIEKAKDGIYRHLAHLNSLFNMPEIAPEVIVEKCDFDGVVLKESFRGTTYWSCPKCGKSYESQIERDYDYD